MTKAFIDIVGRDFTGSAFNTAQSKMSGLTSSVRTLTAGMGALGAVLGAGAFVGAIRGAIDLQDELAKASKATGLTVESLAGLKFAAEQNGTSLDQVSKGVRRFSRLILESGDGTGRYSQIIKALGINLETLKTQSPEEQFKALADGLKDVADQDRAVVVTSLFGNEYAKLIPLLSLGSEELGKLTDRGRELNPVTAESAAKAELFNDNLAELGATTDALAIEFTQDLVPAINSITNEMLAASKTSGIFAAALAGIREAAGQIGGGLGIGENLGKAIFSSPLSFFFEETSEGAEKAKESIAGTGTALDKTGKQAESFIQKFDRINKEFDKTEKGSNKLSSAASKLESEFSKLESEAKSLIQAFDPLARRNDELERFITLLNEGLINRDVFDAAAIDSIERYTTAISEASEETKELIGVTENTTDEVSQLWIQAGRNIQSILADSIFNFFDDGLKGMVRNVGRAVGRIVSEFAALKLAQSIGLDSFFGVSSGDGGGGGGGFDFFDGANLVSAGNTIYQGFSGALAANAGNLIASGGALVGSGSSVAFGTALAGDSIGGLIAGTEAGLSGAAAAEAASSGAAAASGATAATGFGLLALATQIGNGLIANDKEIGGRNADELASLSTTFESLEGFYGSVTSFLGGKLLTDITGDVLGEVFGEGVGEFFSSTVGSFIPDLTGVLTSLFGRGPFKTKETNLIGQVTAEGFEGVTSTKLKSQGGLFRGDRTERVIIDADTLELSDGSTQKFGDFADSLKPSIDLLNFTLDGAITLMNDSITKTADALGLGTTEGFATNINIASQRGEFFTAEEITAELQRVEEEMIRFILPSIDILRQGEETLVEAFQRVGAEFNTLTVLGNALGNSTEATQTFLRGISAGARSGLVSRLGGDAAIAQFSQFFFANFLTEAERSKISIDNLATSLTDAGFAADLSIEQYGELVKSFGKIGGIAEDQLKDLIGLGPQLLSARQGGADVSSDAFSVLSNSINARQTEISTELAGVSSVISELSGVTDLLRSAVNTIQPIGRQQARSLIQQAANDSDFNNPRLGIAIDALTKSSTSGFATRIDFLSDQAKSAGALRELQDAAGDQLSIEEQTLSALESESQQLDGILSNAQSQLDELSGINTNTLSIAEALAAFNSSLTGGDIAQNPNAVSLGTGVSVFNANAPTVSQVSGQDISDFIANNPDPFAVHAAAVVGGISASRLAANSEFSVDQINAFTDANDLPRLATGTNLIPNDMPIFAHKGETVTPRAFVEQDAAERKQMIAVLNDILAALNKIDSSTDQAAEILNDASAGGPLLVEIAA